MDLRPDDLGRADRGVALASRKREGHVPVPALKPERRPPVILAPGPLRSDEEGNGRFGAPRGERTHKGFDYEVAPGSLVAAPVSGTVSKIGRAYKGKKRPDEPNYRIIDIETPRGFVVRSFYVGPEAEDPEKPFVRVGHKVKSGVTPIGRAQDLRKRHGERMDNHVHVEVRDRKRGNQALDPEPLTIWGP